MRSLKVFLVLFLVGGTAYGVKQINTADIANLAITNAKIAASTIDLTAKVTNTLPKANGGTGQTTALAAFQDFYKSVATALGDLVYGGASGTPTRLAGDTSNTKKFLTGQSSAGVAAAPAWGTIASGDVPQIALGSSGAGGVGGTLPFGNGGTGQSSYTDGQLLIGNSSTGGLTKATLSAGANVTITNGNGSISIAASGGGGGGGAQVAFSGFTGFSSGCANQVWRYSATVISSGGTDISVNDSTTLGTQFTALTSGLYDISFNYGGQTGGSTTAIMVNDPSCTTVPTSQSASTTAGVLATCSASGTGIVGTCHAFAKLSANDVITIKTNVTGTSISNDMRTIFHMIKASN